MSVGQPGRRFMRPAAALAALLIGAAAANGDARGPARGSGASEADSESDKDPDDTTHRLLFKLADAVQLAAGDGHRARRAAAVGLELGCPSTRRLFRHAGKHEPAQAKAGLHLWYAAHCDSPLTAKRALTASALTATNVTIIEAEFHTTTSVHSDDAQLSTQQHYDAINLFRAWDLERGRPDVVVQVLDSGLDVEHQDLQNNIWRNVGEICGNGLDDDNNGFIDDCHGYNHADDTGTDLQGDSTIFPHGSHVAGTIAADTDNGVGVAGIAGGTLSEPGAKVMISVGFGKTATGGFAEALAYGANNGALISSNSWGFKRVNIFPQSVKDAIDYADSMESVVVFAAGNAESNADYYPAAYPGVVSVAAVDNDGIAAGFTNYGSQVDISAPGVDVLSTTTKDEYGTASGTSMAAPHVSGVLALGASANPNASKADLLDCLYATARELDAINEERYKGALGAGLLDAFRFVNCAIHGAPSAAPTFTPAPSTLTPTCIPSTAEPSTLAPTLAPTAFLESCGPCDRILILKLQTDDFPKDTGWTLEHTPSTICGSKPAFDSEAVRGKYLRRNSDFEETISASICANEQYTFTVTDNHGDGLCCENGPGSYSLELNGLEIARGAEIGYGEKTVFTTPFKPLTEPTFQPTPTVLPTTLPTTLPTAALAPSALPMAAPTFSPTPTPTAKPPTPTFEPTLPVVDV